MVQLKRVVKVILILIFCPTLVLLILAFLLCLLNWMIRKFLLTKKQQDLLEKFAISLVELRKWKKLQGSDFGSYELLKRQEKIVEQLKRECAENNISRFCLFVCRLESLAYI